MSAFTCGYQIGRSLKDRVPTITSQLPVQVHDPNWRPQDSSSDSSSHQFLGTLSDVLFGVMQQRTQLLFRIFHVLRSQTL